MNESTNLSVLESYLHEHIPLSSAMGVTVTSVSSDSVILSAPLAPNINHRDTVFGGSASAVALLAAWSLLYVRLAEENIDSRIVVQRNIMNYTLPIESDFTAQASVPPKPVWGKFITMLKRKKRARISIVVQLFCNGRNVGELQGEFVALGN